MLTWPGPEDATPRLLLHGAGAQASTWTALAEKWAEHRTVHALDFRGHGESTRSPSYSLAQMRDDTLRVLDHLNPTSSDPAVDRAAIDIVGHSLGGMVGYLVASQRQPHIRRLVLEDAPPPLPVEPPREIPDDPGKDFGFDWQVIRDMYRMRNQPDPRWWDDLNNINIPVLLLCGGPSSHIDQNQLMQMANQIPGCAVTTIDAGHDIHSATPAEFGAVVDDFLASA